ncbi:MAG TPA: ribosome maturation factor RimM [Candidatus Ligilactobacillus excrementigallinarum]|uniref:Ribosome maturation factor RimM n=1 Tax=Candidatus Ligilactobacillus excrementigallinarum TaxID=2838641 RepID=A0A9D2AA31_9LACO|nr:ribosome maturation factor RimM [Candidatus Ligilactobacillus excrementigallinarum]
MEYYQIGKIVNTHGIKGEVRVQATTDFPEKRFAIGEKVYIFKNQKLVKELTIKSHRKHKQFDLLSFEGLEDINLVEDLKQADLKISADQQDELTEGQYYYHEIIGLDVFDLEGNELGQISEIMQSGANDVWIIKRKQKADLLIPAIKDVVKEIQIENHKVIIDLLDGLDD